jgi:hypothetical protein
MSLKAERLVNDGREFVTDVRKTYIFQLHQLHYIFDG